MKRIYHPYWLWEDHKAGFYENCSGENKELLILKGIEMFNCKIKTTENIFPNLNQGWNLVYLPFDSGYRYGEPRFTLGLSGESYASFQERSRFSNFEFK